ncbi:MAG: ParB/RepB/Spo0J family partition protein [Phycisphaerae bacterium]|nr:ParB/RepB/Spo0J family partition protein [Phycisphaerae bacterium]NUQ44835.1 ParB/RepB/Spo0J family partition protein [Phycisphaerae bacterium]
MSIESVQRIHRDKLRPGIQPREDIKRDDSFLALASSIAVVGILYPLLVRAVDAVFLIVDGHRRFFAGLSAGLSEFPVMLQAASLSDAEALQLALISNTHREDLSAWERACSYNRLATEFGWSAAEVARRTATSEASVSRYTTALTLPPELLDQFRRGKLSVSAAYQLAIVRDPEKQRSLAEAAVAGTMSRDQLIKKAKERTPPSAETRKPRPPVRRVVLPLREGNSLAVSGAALRLDAFLSRVQELASQLAVLEPKDMELSDAAARLAAQGG